MTRQFLLGCAIAIVVAAARALAEPAAPPSHVVLVVWDGMRPDFVTEKYAPTLAKLAREGTRFRNHHSVYPTATDVNGAALATGCYPNRNGICANLEFRPTINPRQPLDTSDPDAIKRGDEISDGKYLAVPTFVEQLRAAGRKVALAGTKSVALLFDRKNDWTIVRTQKRPLTIFAGAPIKATQRDELTKLLGPFADDPKATAVQRNDFATRTLTEFLWRDGVADFSLLWLSEPDLSEHNFAPGSPQAIAGIKAVDTNLAAVLSALEKKHARDSTDVFVLSDHGFSTIRRSIDIIALLNSAGFHAAQELSESAKPGDILVAGNAGTVLFYVRDHDRETTQRLVDWLQSSDFAGVIFTRDKFDGTFSLSSVHIDTTTSADVVLAFPWDKEPNQFGVRGRIDGDWNRKAGEGTHATLSPSDVSNMFIAGGPHFRANLESKAPSGNVDIAPTILALLGVRGSAAMEGRQLSEALTDGKDAEQAKVKTLETRRELNGGVYHSNLELFTLGESVYLNAGNGGFDKTSPPPK